MDSEPDTPIKEARHLASVDLSRYPLGLDTSLDQHETAQLLGLKSHRTLAEYRRNGTGPRFWRCGVRPFYLLRSVLDWEKSRTYSSTLEEHEASKRRREDPRSSSAPEPKTAR